MKFNIKFDNTEILKNLKGKARLKVGFFEKSTYETGEYVASVAFWNEFGTISKLGNRHIPPRPFMRNTIAKSENLNLWREIIADLAKKGFKPSQILEILGGEVVGAIQTEITNGNFEPNAPYTIAKKGAGKRPLIDTSLMVSQVAYEVVNV